MSDNIDNMLREIEQRCEAASGRAWEVDKSGNVVCHGFEADHTKRIATVNRELHCAPFNAEAIASAKSDIPRLCAALRVAMGFINQMSMNGYEKSERFNECVAAIARVESALKGEQ